MFVSSFAIDNGTSSNYEFRPTLRESSKRLFMWAIKPSMLQNMTNAELPSGHCKPLQSQECGSNMKYSIPSFQIDKV